MTPNTRRLRRERLWLRAKAMRLLRTARALSRRTAGAAIYPTRQRLSASPLAAQPRSVEAEEKVSEGRITTTDAPIEQLQQAVRDGYLRKVEDILRQQHPGTAAVISSMNESGDACIHVAAKLGHAEIVSLLLHHGAEQDSLGSRSRTPLHLASIYGHLQAVDVLLAAGADVSIALRDASGYEHWALSFASRMGHVHVLEVLLRHGADVMQAGTRGLTALHYAAVRNQAGAVYTLVEAGANIEAAVDDNGGGGTPLHASSVMRCYDAALALLRCGANVESANAFGYSPLHGAARQGGKDGAVRVADLLLRWGADETAVDRDGNRPIDVVGNSRVDEESGRQHDEIDRLRELLANAPADRAWRRRGFLVLCRVFLQKKFHGFHQRQQRRLSAEEVVALKRDSLSTGLSARRRSKTSDPENKMWSELARTETAPQTPKTTAAVASGGGAALGLGESARTMKQRHGRSEARDDLGVAGNGDDFGAILVQLLDLPEEGVFRNALSFL